MEFGWKYLTRNDETATLDLVRKWMPRFAPIAPTDLYHYTTGETFIRIIETGKLWSTQIACLNDAAEVLYAIQGLLRRIRARNAEAHHSEIEPLLCRLEEVLSNPPARNSAALHYLLFCGEGRPEPMAGILGR
jgi:hypothetical protein